VTEKFLIIALAANKRKFECWSKTATEGKHFSTLAFVCLRPPTTNFSTSRQLFAFVPSLLYAG
jgi:hypothetical protein